MKSVTNLDLADLTADQQQIVHRFEKATIMHPNLKAVLRECLLLLKEPTGNPVILLYGPAGVGKSTVIIELHKYFLNTYLDDMKRDPGFIPVAGVEAIPSEKTFKWEDYYDRALVALDEPLIDYKVLYGPSEVQRSGSGEGVAVKGGKREAALRQALENALKNRKVKLFTVDEAEHINNMVRGRAIEDQLNIIKSLANLSQTVHLLAGSYRILSFRNLDGQLSRRTINIEFPRYKLKTQEDRKAFKSVLSQFLSKLNVNDHDELMKHWEFFYDHSIGCVGTLKDWMTRALTRQLLLGDDVIELRHFEETALSASQCLVMAREALEGERQLENEKRETDLLKKILRGMESSAHEVPAGKPATETRAKNKPGKRNPHRDPVGT